jgi:hypothetical protein
MEHENLEEQKSSWGGSRAGAGRPQGATNKIPIAGKREHMLRSLMS